MNTIFFKQVLQSIFKNFGLPKNTVHKVLYDMDLLHFHAVSFDEIGEINPVYSEEEFYNDSIKGIPTYIFVKDESNKSTPYPYPKAEFMINNEHLIAVYKNTDLCFSTNAVTGISGLELIKVVNDITKI